MEKTGQTALLIGATGLVGGHLLQQLLDHPAYTKVVALTRRPLEQEHAKLRQHIFDFDRPDQALVQGDDLYCALGTTLKQAGSQEAQYRIDCTYPAEIGRIGRRNGMRQFLLVSSVGANAAASNFYLRTKGELEDQLGRLHFPALVIARPSILLGDRREVRIGERLGIGMTRLLEPLMLGRLRKYRGIRAANVARALIALAQAGLSGVEIFESDQLQLIARAR